MATVGLTLTIDASKVAAELQHLGNPSGPVIERARLAMKKVGLQMLNDAVMEQPTVPHLTGNLRGSGSAMLDGKAYATSAGHAKASGGTPALDAAEGQKSGHIVVTVAYNTAYAARLHEHPGYNFTEPGSGGKFLDKKLEAHKEEYVKFIAEHMRG